MNKVQKGSYNYECKDCDYHTSRESQYNRHLSTTKHKLRTNGTNRTDLVHIKPTKEEAQARLDINTARKEEEGGNSIASAVAVSLEPLLEVKESAVAARATFQTAAKTSGDALPCTNCGSLALVRNGTCHLCTNCGTTTGCS